MINFIVAIVLRFILVIFEVYEAMKQPVFWSVFCLFFGAIITALFMTVAI